MISRLTNRKRLVREFIRHIFENSYCLVVVQEEPFSFIFFFFFLLILTFSLLTPYIGAKNINNTVGQSIITCVFSNRFIASTTRTRGVIIVLSVVTMTTTTKFATILMLTISKCSPHGRCRQHK